MEVKFKELSDVQLEVEALKSLTSMQKKLIEALETNVDDLLGRARRNTLIFRGFSEGVKGKAWHQCKEFMEEFLSRHFGIEDAYIERAHRTPSVKHASRTAPRPITVAFLRWEMANKIVYTARKVLKDNPFLDASQNKVDIYIDQMYSPKI